MQHEAAPIPNERKSPLAILSFILAAAGAGSAAMIGLTSFTTFNPPDWLRILTMAPLPFLMLLTVVFGVMSLKAGTGRGWAIAGLVIVAMSAAGFAVMIGFGG